VVGGVLSVLFSIYLGFTVTLVVGLDIYLLAYALISRLRTVSRSASQAGASAKAGWSWR
jgi:hypothetical protein